MTKHKTRRSTMPFLPRSLFCLFVFQIIMLKCLPLSAVESLSSQKKNLCLYSVGSCLSLLLHYLKIHNLISNWFLQKPNREGCFSSLPPTIPSAVAPFPFCTLDFRHMQQKDVCVHNRTPLENKSYFSSAAKTSAISDTFTFYALPDMCNPGSNF